MYKAIDANKRNTVIIMAVFAAIIGAIGWMIAYFVGDMSIAVYTLIFAAAYALIQYFLATKIAVAMTGAKEIQKKDNPRLYTIVENLTITTGMPMPKVYIIDDPAPNAFATGRDPKHAIVAATTGLLDMMDDNEVTAVMAHELSHVRNYDIRVSMIVFGLVCAIGLLADIGGRVLMRGSGDREGKGQAVGFILGLAIYILAPIFAAIAQMAVSRQREYLADASAVMITRYPEGMIGALKKLQAGGRPMMRQNSATDAMYISNPLKKGFMNSLFSTHPPLEKRIERLQQSGKTF